jgi:hypothetical protein
VGDAAGACDPLTGEGIGQALLTGTLAARAILDAGALQPELAASGYRRAVAGEWLPDHRMAALLSRALRSDGVARAAIRLAGASDWTRRSFGRWLLEDEPLAAAVTPPLAPPVPGRPGAYAPGSADRSMTKLVVSGLSGPRGPRSPAPGPVRAPR